MTGDAVHSFRPMLTVDPKEEDRELVLMLFSRLLEALFVTFVTRHNAAEVLLRWVIKSLLAHISGVTVGVNRIGK